MLRVFFIGLFLAIFQVACDTAPRGSFPALPAQIRLDRFGKYQVEKRQVPTPTSLLPVCTPEQLNEPPSCPGYKVFGWCGITNDMLIASIMANCDLACGRCREPPPVTTAPPVCIADISSSCEGYKRIGLCDIVDTSISFVQFLAENCNATCGECEPPTTMAPTTERPITPSTMAPSSTEAPPTEPPSTMAPPTEPPSTMAPPTEPPSTMAPPSEPPSTMAPPTEPPSTLAPPTEPPSTMAPPTEQPSTMAPPTEPPSTMAPSTELPSTMAPPTEPPSTMAPPTEPPSTMAPPTEQPSTMAPPTEPPSTMAPSTELPSTMAPPTEPPSTMAPPTEPPTTMAPPTEPPSTMAPPTEPPSTLAPPTEPPSTMAPPTELPSTMAPSTEPPSTIPPPTELPSTMVPRTEPPSTMAPPSELPSTMAPTLSPEDAAACLQYHNAKRTLHGSPQLTWSDVLAQHAQAWADHLAATETFVHEQGINEGENLYWSRASTARNCSAAVESWYSEELLYDYDRPPQTIQEFLERDIGHFTQIVWKGTTMVGVGIATVVEGNPPIQTYIVARYAPPGNVIGRFAENVMRPVVPI